MVAAQCVFLLVKVPMVYGLFFILDKYLARKWSVAKTVLSAIMLFILAMAVFIPVKQYIVLQRIYGAETTLSAALNFISILYTVFLLGFVCSMAIAIKLIRWSILQRKLQQEMIKTKLESELQFLKAQINPHFLFNTLNNIYVLARKKSDDTADVVMKLSKLFRFILYEAKKKTILIGGEIQVLENYIELERIRYNDKLDIRFTQSVDNGLQAIAPLVLLPFVENAFKHGASESRFNSYVHIDLKVEQANLYFMCENSIAEEAAKNESEKIGLRNVSRQLELLYPGHVLEISNGKTWFRVVLKLKLLRPTI